MSFKCTPTYSSTEKAGSHNVIHTWMFGKYTIKTLHSKQNKTKKENKSQQKAPLIPNKKTCTKNI